jgi:hypothetical protein
MTRFQCWIAAWVDVIVGLIGVISLGFYRPWWDFSYSCWITKRNLKKKM